ncbi:plastocyanin/azurin family copper-binding protein [Planococcus sp. YIM B11945]|uniref:plastocyanin/azurin family copper-binding protein n=1 Tax=Planococcus sp. YIM B11945 TaxID=3435410 RepID=UPI003D7E53A4
MNKKFSAMFVGGLLLLGACGGEAQQANQEMPAEDMNAQDHEKEEKPAAEPSGDNPAEAKSGEASPLIAKGEKVSYLFNEAGEFPIHCQPHPKMTMTVLVEEGADISGEAAIEIADFAYGEETITVAPGTTITWTNQDDVQHNVTFD